MNSIVTCVDSLSFLGSIITCRAGGHIGRSTFSVLRSGSHSHSGWWREDLFERLPYFAIYNAHPRVWPKLSGKISFMLIFNYLFIDTCFLYYKRILAFIYEHNLLQEILCNNYKTRTDKRYFRYYPCIMHILIFPSKIWAKSVHYIQQNTIYCETFTGNTNQSKSFDICLS